MLRSSLLILASLVIATSCYQCTGNNGTTTINPPSDLSKLVFYPAGYSDGQPIPTLDKNQGCFLVVNIPTGYYAMVTFYRQFPYEYGSYVLSANNQLTLLKNNDFAPFVFIYPTFKVSFSTDNSTDIYNFAMKVVYTKLPQVTRKIVPITNGQPPVPVIANNQITTFVGSPNSMLAIMPFSLVDQSQNSLLRQTAIFNGDSFTDGCLGSLDNIIYIGRPLVTYGHRLSVYTFGLSDQIDYPLFMSQDYQDIRAIGKYEGANCPNTGNCEITLLSTTMSSMKVTDYNGSEFIKSFDSFPDDSMVNVYQNNRSNSTMIASLTKSNYQSLLPLEVKGTMKFYEHIGRGDITMTVTRDASRASRH